MSEIAADDLAACRAMLNDGSRSFRVASLLLPGRVRRPATALYAFCRVADDLIDGGAPGALEALHRRLDAIYAGRPGNWPEDRALAAVVQAHRVPRLLLDWLLEGLAWDAAGRRYEDLPALEAYAARVAGTVGAVMALLMGVRAPATLARACDLGVAMQLTNIARDVGEDARAGRLYLPLSWLAEAGIDAEAFLRAPRASPALAGVISRLLAAADALYRRADTGIAALPVWCRPGIGVARLLYSAIGQQVVRNGCDSVTRRARVPGARKLALAGSSLARTTRALTLDLSAPLVAVDALVVAAATAPMPARAPGIADRLVWTLTLFSELDARQAGRI